jgi:hypothetical protein
MSGTQTKIVNKNATDRVVYKLEVGSPFGANTLIYVTSDKFARGFLPGAKKMLIMTVIMEGALATSLYC